MSVFGAPDVEQRGAEKNKESDIQRDRHQMFTHRWGYQIYRETGENNQDWVEYCNPATVMGTPGET